MPDVLLAQDLVPALHVALDLELGLLRPQALLAATLRKTGKPMESRGRQIVIEITGEQTQDTDGRNAWFKWFGDSQGRTIRSVGVCDPHTRTQVRAFGKVKSTREIAVEAVSPISR